MAITRSLSIEAAREQFDAVRAAARHARRDRLPRTLAITAAVLGVDVIAWMTAAAELQRLGARTPQALAWPAMVLALIGFVVLVMRNTEFRRPGSFRRNCARAIPRSIMGIYGRVALLILYVVVVNVAFIESHLPMWAFDITTAVGVLVFRRRMRPRSANAHVQAARSRLRLTVTAVRALQRLSKPWVVAEAGNHRSRARNGSCRRSSRPCGRLRRRVRRRSARVLDIAASAAKELLEAGSTTWVTPLVAVARHMEEGVVEHDGMGVDVVRARHLGEHLALMPAHEPAPVPHIVPGATGPRRRRIAELHAESSAETKALAEALFGIDLSATQRGR